MLPWALLLNATKLPSPDHDAGISQPGRLVSGLITPVTPALPEFDPPVDLEYVRYPNTAAATTAKVPPIQARRRAPSAGHCQLRPGDRSISESRAFNSAADASRVSTS